MSLWYNKKIIKQHPTVQNAGKLCNKKTIRLNFRFAFREGKHSLYKGHALYQGSEALR